MHGQSEGCAHESAEDVQANDGREAHGALPHACEAERSTAFRPAPERDVEAPPAGGGLSGEAREGAGAATTAAYPATASAGGVTASAPTAAAPPPPPPPPPLPPLVDAPATFVLGAGVTADHQAVIKRGLAIGETYYRTSLGHGLPAVTAYVEDDHEGMAQLFAATFPAPIAEARLIWQTATASAYARKIYVYVGSASWIARDDDTRAKILAHEAFHILQQEMAGLQRMNAGADEVPASGPRWLEEGSAEFAAFRALAVRGLIRMEDIRAQWISRTKLTTSPLQARETTNGLFAQPEPYQVSPLAIDVLLGTRSDALLAAYYEAVGSGEAWQSAFAGAFGKSIATFYAEFEAYRATL